VGDDLAALIADTADEWRDGDVLVIAQKVVSKAEGRTRRLADVRPGERALELASKHAKDARLVQVILDETAELLRADHGVLICETHHGLVCANAGVDMSNTPGPDVAVLLPDDPDGSARRLRTRLRELTGVRVGVLISDSFGRAWRLGLTDVAIGAAGIDPLEDWRGRADARGRELQATEVALADELAAAADLARTKDSREPVVLIRGAARAVTQADGPGAAALRRPPALDLFR
jgi:coenzyme F420-0:L-glutamate ligase/coenzyme F420-1:gamma-L-glutamate ligase